MSGKVGIDDLIAAHKGGRSAREAVLRLQEFEVFDETSHVPLATYVYDAKELDALDLPEREVLIDGVLDAGSMTLIFGPTGVGKSWFILALLHSLTTPLQKLLPWRVEKSVRCLLVDGEMPLQSLQARFRLLGISHNGNLLVLPSEQLYHLADPLNLNDYEQQDRIFSLLDELESSERRPEVIVFDNLSSLTAGFDENSNSDLDALLHFLIALRHRGYAVILIHHAGKSGDQRGASRRTDLMDTVIKLAAVSDVVTGQAAFEVTFPKVRGVRPDPDAITVHVESRGNKVELTYRGKRSRRWQQWEEVLRIVRDSRPQSAEEVARAMKLNVITARQHIRKAKDSGYLEQKRRPTLTSLGIKHIEALDDHPRVKY
jgi:archaellum biogenesis ATPase FlaH